MDLKKITTGKRPVFFVLFGLCLVAVVFYILLAKKASYEKEIPMAQAVVKPFEVTVGAVGQLDSVNALTISSELKGEVKIIYLVEEGVKVKKGDVLVRFDAKTFEEKVSTLETKVKEWEAVVNASNQIFGWEKNQAVQEIKAADFDLKVAELELQKIQEGDGPLEISRLEEELIEKKNNCEELKAYIKDLQDLEKRGYSYPVEIEQSNKKLEKLQKEYTVAKQKYETYVNFYLPTSIETSRSKVERFKMMTEQTKKGVGFKIGKAKADFNKAVQELDSYKSDLSYAKRELEKTVVYSPQEGIVVMKERFQNGEFRKPRVGDVVFSNQPILFLPDISVMMVKVLIKEIDLNKVAVGKAVTIKVDAYPDLKLTGKVSFIGTLAERREEIRGGGEKYFKVSILVSGNDESLRPGMTARVEIVVREGKRNSLTIPINAVFQENEENFTFVAFPGGYQKRRIKIGLQNLESVEVLDGIKKGEVVCLAKPPL